MNPQAFAFNSKARYKAADSVYGRGATSHTLSASDFAETDVTVRAIQVDGSSSSWGAPVSFKTKFVSIFDKYKMPLVKTDALVKSWSSAPMDWWQNQLNFAVWCATSGCGMSAQDHLQASEPLMRSIYLFHVYYTTRRILTKIQAPLPQDQAWSPMANPYDRGAYERICNEFGVSPHTNWHVPGPNHGLGRVYFYAGGYVPAYGAIDSDNYNPDKMSFTKSTTSKIVHVDFIKQDSPEAGEAWRQFILDKSEDFTRAGVERVNDSIRAYVWAILGSQAQTHTGILGAGTAFDAQKQFVADVEDAISSPVDLPSAIKCYQDTLQYAHTEVNFAFGTGLYMAPRDMLLRVGRVTGYNNQIVIATPDEALGLNLGFNAHDAPPPNVASGNANDTGEEGLVKPQNDSAGIGSASSRCFVPGTSMEPGPADGTSSTPKNAEADDHEDEKTALVIGGVALGLCVLWLIKP